jgi:uncharacterized repeat protein (TIGR03847 family)
MPGNPHNFGQVVNISASAIGSAGQRQFRLIMHSSVGSVIMWLEKEQLYQLAIAVQRLLSSTQLDELQETSESKGDIGADSDQVHIEFKVGRLALGHDQGVKRFVLAAHDIESDEDSQPKARCVMTRTQAGDLSEEALAVCAAGRPKCPLCGAPMGPDAHVCPRSNGHNLE